MRRNLFGLFKPLLLSFILIIFFTAPAAAKPQKQWADLTTAAAANGSTVTTRVFGYYADVEGFGQVFVICNPNTGEETGDAFIPNAKVGEKQAQKIVRYDRKYDIDWDHPKQVNPVRVSLIAPNIPTDTRYDVEYYRQTGQLKRKTENQFAWPMSYSFARMIPGSDPNYWLIVALVENPNPFPVKADVTTSIRSWTSGWQSEGINFNGTVPLGPNETKYIILNTGQKKEFLLDDWGDWPSPGYSLAYYNARIAEINSPDYPDTLKSDGKYGFFTTYVRWDGTNPTVYPLFPMRLAFDFSCWSNDDSYSSYWYGYYSGREFPQCYGHAEYDPETGQWSITVSFRYFEKPWYMSDAKWQEIYNTAVNKAVSALKPLFEKWYPKVPFWSAWSKDPYLRVNGETGEYITNGSWPQRNRPSFEITFKYLEPAPPRNAPPVPGSDNWWSNTRWGGWLYTTWGSWSYGYELTAPALFRYKYYWWDKDIQEMNWQSYSYRDSRVYVPKGTGVYKKSVDVRYYDPEWMDNIPVVEAQPMFLEQYSFVPTEGSFGYLKKEIVPGYLLCVEREQRPLLNIATQPVEVRAKCGYVDIRNVQGSRWYGVWREWRWRPSTGWQYMGETISPSTSGLKNDTAVWELSFKYSHTVSGSNPANFPASWTNRWGGGAPSLYWTSTKTFKARVEGMADRKRVYNKYWESRKRVYNKYWESTYTPDVDYMSVDPLITLPGVPSLAPGESKWIVSSDKTAAVRFWKTPIRSRYTWESWDVFQNRVLNEINTNIILPLLSSQEEAAFNNGGRFVMTPTFTAGQGGVAAGAQKKLIYRDLIWSSKWEYYRFGDYLRETTIGFPYAGITLRSYVTNYSPTDGLVVKGRDEYLGDILRIRNEIPFSKYEPSGQQHWRSYDPHTDSVSPPPYPEDR